MHSQKRLKILVTAIDLEQSEHRGIAVYSKNLVKALHDLGHEIWLLTSYKKNHPSTAELITHLDYPIASSKTIGEKIIPRWLKNIIPNSIKKILRSYFGATSERKAENPSLEAKKIEYAHQKDCRYNERMAYLKYINGFININNIYEFSLTHLRNLKKNDQNLQPINIDAIKEFDLIISTCPLAIKFETPTPIIQTVHDIIPIEIPEDHPGDISWEFHERIKIACQATRTITVSETTRNKLITHGLSTTPSNITILYQPSSYSSSPPDNLLTGEEKILDTFKIKKNKYFITIGSIEPRKNILPLARAFIKSKLVDDGFALVCVGQLKKDLYSKELMDYAAKNPNVVLTDFINDYTRDILLKHSFAFAFASKLEGYGIPLVDAIENKKPIICSDIEVFRELANNQACFVECFNENEWINAFRNYQCLKPAIPDNKFTYQSFRDKLNYLVNELTG